MSLPESPSDDLSDAATTPMMAQYLAIKKEYADCLLFYRMGDFYEMFFDDAVKAAEALDITLTKRGRHAGDDIPMCGVPVHAHEGYLSRLIRAGFKVAVCEQTEDPAEAKKRGAKSVVSRDVIRVVTPGTITEDSLLDARLCNYLAALADAQNTLALAWLDISTGEFYTQPLGWDRVAAVLARVSPGELLLPERLYLNPELNAVLSEWKSVLVPLPSARFDSENARHRLQSLYGVGVLDGFGMFSRAEVAAAGVLVDYTELTQKGRLPHLSPPHRLADDAMMDIDAATRRNLELVETLSGQRAGSLLSVVDKTVSGTGARLLAQYLAAPLTDPDKIGDRLDMVSFFVDDETMRKETRTHLKACPDIERALSRLTLGRGGPRDLAVIHDGLKTVPILHAVVTGNGLTPPPPGIRAALVDLGQHDILVDRLGRALAENLPVLVRDGGFIAPGYHDGLDELRALRDESRRLIANLQTRYVADSGVPTLKIKHNNILGYYIEVPPKQADKIAPPFIHRQTLASAVRYTTSELADLDDRIRGAAERALALEMELFADLVTMLTAQAEPVARAAHALAILDVSAGLGELAVLNTWNRPKVDDSLAFIIDGGRHPVVEDALRLSGGEVFVANDCDLGDNQRLWLITGPNMAGKSTFLRQNALIAILAQMGSYVPADRAHIGVIDRLFSRVGAADDLARGRSTFMVEMVETAAILNQAGPRSLVILDEIGRGTATFDGLSIAWATIENLHDVNQCRALFATHYHELTALTARLPQLSCHCMKIKEWHGDVIFLHEVGPGAADRSYGIHVARLAGLPAGVIKRAQQVLETLEKSNQSSAITRLADDLPLFAAALRPEPEPPAEPTGPSELEIAFRAVNPDELTPRQALEALYALREKLR